MKNTLRVYAIVLIFLTSIFWVACGGGDGTSSVSNTDFEASETLSIAPVPAGSRTLFGLTGENGNITITGSSGTTSVTITGTKRVKSESVEDAQAHLADLDVDVDLEESPSAVFVETIQPQFTGGRNYIVDYTITLPSNFQVLVENFNGNVTIDGIDNKVSVVAFNGDVTLGQINGSASVALFNGTIDAEVALPSDGEIKFDTVNGAIFLDIPVSTSAEFLASAANGSINITNLMLQNQGGTPPTSLSGTLGAGEGTIDLEVDNGDINVSGF
jgi:DUF4097 and DUF4098 domain-containing protein YvlB